MTIAASKTHTAKQYLAFEIESDIRSEFRDGKIVPMTGGTPAHNKLASALNALLWFGLRGKPYSVFVTDQRLWIPTVNLYTYPDVMVIADPVDLKPGRKDTVTNPLLIAEVLSESTQTYDRIGKSEAYRSISTFQEYLLIDQYRPYVETFVRQSEGNWTFTAHSNLANIISLSSLGIDIALANIYEQIQFANG